VTRFDLPDPRFPRRYDKSPPGLKYPGGLVCRLKFFKSHHTSCSYLEQPVEASYILEHRSEVRYGGYERKRLRNDDRGRAIDSRCPVYYTCLPFYIRLGRGVMSALHRHRHINSGRSITMRYSGCSRSGCFCGGSVRRPARSAIACSDTLCFSERDPGPRLTTLRSCTAPDSISMARGHLWLLHRSLGDSIGARCQSGCDQTKHVEVSNDRLSCM